MIQVSKKIAVIAVMLWVIVAAIGCRVPGSKNTARVSKKTIGDGDDAYYQGLQKVDAGDLEGAARDFERGIEAGGKYCAKKSVVEYLKLGSKKERATRAILCIETGGLDELVAGCVALCDSDSYDKVLFYTDNYVEKSRAGRFRYDEKPEDLCYARIKALQKMEDERYREELNDWFYSDIMTTQKIDYYKNIKEDIKDYPEILFRVLVYQRDYWGALSLYKKNASTIPKVAQFFSDLGKVCLYTQYKTATKSFAVFARPITTSTTPDDYKVNYYVWFYMARMYAKSRNVTNASACYKRALQMAAAIDAGRDFDNAVWYYIDMCLKEGVDSGIEAIKEYAPQWHDATYFCDIYNLLLPTLLTHKMYDAIRELIKTTDGFAADETIARYAYVYARLLQLGITRIPDTDITKDKKETFRKGARTLAKDDAKRALTEAINLYTRALESGSDYYYRAMALYRLIQIFEARRDPLLKTISAIKDIHDIKSRTASVLLATKVTDDKKIDKDAGRYLLGYAKAGVYEKIYSEYMDLYNKGIVIDTNDGIKLSQELQDVGLTNYDYWPQSLRIATKVTKTVTHTLTKSDWETTFPRDYKSYMTEYCEKYAIPESHMYALVRSESFFDHDVDSFAGAHGLCQLMDKTAAEIARKLKIKEYDLRSPDININFGCFYVAELNRRLGGKWLSTFFSYNAGIGRVRKWQKDMKKYFPKLSTLEEDLMLEILPIEETREYGRKLVGATVMYAYIYENKSVTQIMRGLGL